MRLLLVEDNRELAGMVVDGLSRAGLLADHCPTLAEARDALRARTYALVILDLGLPDGDGTVFLAEARREGLMAPVLLLTARSGLNDKVAGLDAGADDYLTKPFEISELAARCRALLRRPGAPLGVRLTVGDLAVDTAGRTVEVAGHALDLPPREFALLELLARLQGTVLRRSRLETALYSMDEAVSPNALDAVVSRLRRHLAAAGSKTQLRTVHGVGYALTVGPGVTLDA